MGREGRYDCCYCRWVLGGGNCGGVFSDRGITIVYIERKIIKCIFIVRGKSFL